MLKDISVYFPSEHAPKLGFQVYDIDPVMEIDIRHDWTDFDHYLAAMKSRYRSSIQKTRQAAEHIQRRQLNAAEIETYGTAIDSLYETILDTAGFCPVRYNASAFARQQRLMEDQCETIGYFHDNTLLAFNTRYLTPDVLYSHYFGSVDDEAELELYRNIMLDDLERAIELGVKRVHLGRNSQAFKSALGAVAVSSPSWITHRNFLGRALLRVVVRHISAPEWEPRNPYRDAS